MNDLAAVPTMIVLAAFMAFTLGAALNQLPNQPRHPWWMATHLVGFIACTNAFLILGWRS